jgi:hypothetical protein
VSVEALPHWKDTVALLKTKGYTDEQITSAADAKRKMLGKAARTEDFVLWTVALGFGVEVPKITTMERKPRGEAKPITAGDVTREFGETNKDQEFAIEGWVLNPVEYYTKTTPPKPRIKVAFVDSTGSTQITCFGEESCEHWRNHELDYPSFVRLEGLQVFALGEDGVTLTHGKFARCTKLDPAYPLEKALPDASDAYVAEGKLARIQGFVTDESQKTWKRCSKCGKGDKNCKGHQGGQTYEDQEIHTVTVFDGNARHTLVMFDELAPRRKLYGFPIEAIGLYRKKEKGPGEFEAVIVNVGAEPAFKPLPTTLKPESKPAPAPRAAPQRSGDNAVWPQTVDVLNRALRPHRLRPVTDVLQAFQEAGIGAEDAQDQMNRACAQGIVRAAGEQYQWMGGDPQVGEPPAAAPAPATSPAASAPPASSEERSRQRKVMGLVRKLDDGKGAPWDKVAEAAASEGMDAKMIDETIEAMLTTGDVWEPVLGRLKPKE